MKGNQRLNVAVSIISGILLALAFPKFNLWPLAWVALVPFFIALAGARDWRNAIRLGWAFGLPYFAVSFFWFTSLFRFAGFWIYLAWFCLTVYQTLFILLFCVLFFFLRSRFVLRITNYVLRSMFFPFLASLLWVLVEWLRGVGLFGVTNGVVGYSQSPFLPIIQLASFATVYGVSFLVVFFNAAIASLFWKPATERRGFLSLGIAIILILIAWAYGETSISHSSLVISHFPRIALIQPSIDQLERMDQRLVTRNYEIQAGMTRQAATLEPEMIVWPETAVFAYLLRDPMLMQRVRDLAGRAKRGC